MKALIFAGGFSTRFRDSALSHPEYRHLANIPKALLPVAGRPTIDYIIDKLLEVDGLHDLVIVTNNKDYNHFMNWKKSFNKPLNVELINDGATSNENRRGAIRDIAIGVGRDPKIRAERIDEPVICLPGDRIFEFSLADLVGLYNKRKTTIILSYDCGNLDKVRNSAEIVTNSSGRVVDFFEKPAHPKSTLICPCIYILAPGSLDKLPKYLVARPSDPVGLFIMWLYRKEPVYAFVAKGYLLDLGNVQSFEAAGKFFKTKI